jgi:glycerate kinase
MSRALPNTSNTPDLVLTAEGAIDSQTPQGKTLAGVARAAQLAKNGAGVPVIAFGGAVKLSGEELALMGIVAALPLPNAPLTLEECIARADELLASATERALRLWLSGQN